jgi:hypothetical protein
MEFPGFNIEADLAPLTALHHATSSSPTAQLPQSQANNPTNFQFQTTIPEGSFPPRPDLSGDLDRKVFFITNCGSLLGKTIAQIALERGHYVAACAREKHLGDLNVGPGLNVF